MYSVLQSCEIHANYVHTGIKKFQPTQTSNLEEVTADSEECRETEQLAAAESAELEFQRSNVQQPATLTFQMPKVQQPVLVLQMPKEQQPVQIFQRPEVQYQATYFQPQPSEVIPEVTSRQADLWNSLPQAKEKQDWPTSSHSVTRSTYTTPVAAHTFNPAVPRQGPELPKMTTVPAVASTPQQAFTQPRSKLPNNHVVALQHLKVPESELGERCDERFDVPLHSTAMSVYEDEKTQYLEHDESISNSSDNSVPDAPVTISRAEKQSHVQKSKNQLAVKSRRVRRDGTESEPEIDDLMPKLIVTSSVQQEERCASGKEIENITDPEDDLIVNSWHSERRSRHVTESNVVLDKFEKITGQHKQEALENDEK
ncbi:uncharacterized protein LOC125431332 [Sphaerodactylus townsendi]|uniref:uncharacterized protein LOC125431332 n=1 Tax=Sphaerodactylus townsendi TaxID=933632 RepID=UPI0020265F93|nr:uncharacterized protein LOC125431332 [Sphaerodactylus townsendi]